MSNSPLPALWLKFVLLHTVGTLTTIFSLFKKTKSSLRIIHFTKGQFISISLVLKLFLPFDSPFPSSMPQFIKVVVSGFS